METSPLARGKRLEGERNIVNKVRKYSFNRSKKGSTRTFEESYLPKMYSILKRISSNFEKKEGRVEVRNGTF